MHVILYSDDPVDQNPVLAHYVSLIEHAMVGLGHTPIRVTKRDISSVRHADVTVTVDAKAFQRAEDLWPNATKGIWFQGIMPEEVLMSRKNPFYYMYWRHLEKRAYRRADACLMVSEDMQLHFESLYKTTRPTYIVPCRNRDFHRDAISIREMVTPSFVYAGGLNAWQEFDLTLELFRKIKGEFPKATLSVYTKDLSEAQRKTHKDKDVKVSTLSESDLDKALGTHSFGFVLRKKSAVNAVSTPTKISTYLAAGVVPIVTDAVGFYARVARVENFPLLETGRSLEQWTLEISKIMSRSDIGVDLCERMYMSLYCSSKTKSQIEEFCKRLTSKA